MDPNEIRKAMKEMKDMSSLIIEVAFSVAKSNRAYYEALLEQGFTKAQALELVKSNGMNMRGS